MLCSQVSFVPGNVARGVFVVLVGRRKGGSPPKVGTPKGSSVMSFVFEIASHTAVTTAQDEDGWTDTALRVIQATQVVRILERVPWM